MENLLDSISTLLEDKNEQILMLLEEIKQEVKSITEPRGRTPADDEEEEIPTNGGRYEVVDFIGLGTYGTVYSIRDNSTQQCYAMKTIPLVDNELDKNVAREISVLLDTNHDNIVRLKQVFTSPGCINLVMEYIPNNLNEQLNLKPERFKCSSVIKMCLRQILGALAHMHNKHIAHRDVKPENILVDNEMNLKLADFGMARFLDVQLTPEVTTLQYRAPEVLLGCSTYTVAVDIWAVGCIFVEFLQSSPLFKEGSELDVICDIFSKLGVPTEADWPGLHSLSNFPGDLSTFPEQAAIFGDLELDPDGNDLLTRLLTIAPSNRITAEEALKHPYLQDV